MSCEVDLATETKDYPSNEQSENHSGKFYPNSLPTEYSATK